MESYVAHSNEAVNEHHQQVLDNFSPCLDQYKVKFGLEVNQRMFEDRVQWDLLSGEGQKLLTSWDPKYQELKEMVLQDRHQPRLIPQFSVNSNINLLTQMQINLHCSSRNKNNMRKNCVVTKPFEEDFDKEISHSSLLSRDQRFYLVNAIFCNTAEVDGYLSRPAHNQGESFKNCSLLEIHSNLFSLVKFFCKVDKEVLEACANNCESQQLLYEYTIRWNAFVDFIWKFASSLHDYEI